jgi:cysteinyl-tRNA synthetase
MPDYGQLSKRPLDEQQAGARVAVEAHKRHPADFVLWKQSSAGEPGWESRWGRGRPGWHIECSAMSERYLGKTFDIHGGGLDLIFPHHENEIAQSRCAHGTPTMANVWMHNGFLQVEGRKMSKSDGNFVTIHDLLETDKFGGRKWPGEVLRLAMLMTHYREPIDFSVARLEEAERILKRWNLAAEEQVSTSLIDAIVLDSLANDLDMNGVLARLHTLARELGGWKLAESLQFLGLLWPPADWPRHDSAVESIAIGAKLDARLAALNARDFAKADTIRADLLAQGIQLMDYKDPATGERRTKWEVKR